MHKISAIFLDRDGVINLKLENDYVKKWEEFKFLPNAAPAIKFINDRNIPIFIITNQSGVGRGLMTKEDLHKIHRRMLEELKNAEAKIDDIFVCPHSPEDNCDCRKPKAGLFGQVLKKYPNIDLKTSWFIGDSDIDEQAGKSAGCSTYLIKKEEDLREVVEKIIGK